LTVGEIDVAGGIVVGSIVAGGIVAGGIVAGGIVAGGIGTRVWIAPAANPRQIARRRKLKTTFIAITSDQRE